MESTKVVDTQKALIRTLVDNIYDIQATRIAMGNRLIASLRDLGIIVEGPKPLKRTKRKTDVEDDNADSGKDKSKEDNAIIIKILGEYKKVSEVYAEKFSNRGSITKAIAAVQEESVYIKSELTYNMITNFVQMSQLEKQMNGIVSKEVMKHPMWDAFFKDVKGCGVLMSAVCIAYFDPYKARWPSSFWKYAGLDVVTDENGSHGRCRSDTVMREYVTRSGEVSERKSLTFNPTVKTKLVGVLGTSFLRTGSNDKYAKIYYDYKNRLENRSDCADLKPVAIYRRAIRYCIKQFLSDMWFAWRELEGLPTGEPYAVAKLGMKPHHDPRDFVEEGAEAATDEDVLNAATSL